MSRPRLHRLPQRLDYTLIPAPLDLSLDTITEKSPLPAIIVTPPCPSSSKDFAIAFLAPPPKPSFGDRCRAYAKSASVVSFRARTVLFVLLLLFILFCHLFTHRMASRRQYLEFTVQETERHMYGSPFASIFDFDGFWGEAVVDEKREFVI